MAAKSVLSAFLLLALVAAGASASDIAAVDSGGEANIQIENALPDVLKKPLDRPKQPVVPLGPRSLLQACRKEIPRLCPEKKALVKCLSEKSLQIVDDECKSWVVARDSCAKAAKVSPMCTPKDSPRQCLRKVAESELPPECVNSEFYKSVKKFSMFRKNPGKSGLLGKIGQK